jgi:hypothetical protein
MKEPTLIEMLLMRSFLRNRNGNDIGILNIKANKLFPIFTKAIAVLKRLSQQQKRGEVERRQGNRGWTERSDNV